jgi:hypothetical protein
VRATGCGYGNEATSWTRGCPPRAQPRLRLAELITSEHAYLKDIVTRKRFDARAWGLADARKTEPLVPETYVAGRPAPRCCQQSARSGGSLLEGHRAKSQNFFAFYRVSADLVEQRDNTVIPEAKSHAARAVETLARGRSLVHQNNVMPHRSSSTG